jgi:hypothetical protein
MSKQNVSSSFLWTETAIHVNKKGGEVKGSIARWLDHLSTTQQARVRLLVGVN